MIKEFKHKGLEKFFKKGIKSGIQAKHAARLRLILARLDAATSIQDMDIPSFNLHELSGNRKEIWAVKVSGNWRITFKIINGHAYIVIYEDYH